MSFDLTNKNISDTFQNLLQKTGSEGHLYDLIGNKVDNLTIGGTLTAHSYITSESIVNTSSGSTAFGNTLDDSHTFIGNITASGNISSSGYISASSFAGDGSGLTGVTSTAEWDGTRDGDAQITGSLILSGSGDTTLTVEGNIIASNGVNVLDSDGSVFQTAGTQGYTLRLQNSNNTGFIDFRTGNSLYTRMQLDGAIELNGSGNIIAGGSLNLSASAAGHITASGNISASGDITALNFFAGPSNEGTIIGYDTAAPSDVTGTENTMLGYNAGALMTSAKESTAVGHAAMARNVTGRMNVAIGDRAFYSATQGGNQVAVGGQALNALLPPASIGVGSYNPAGGPTNGIWPGNVAIGWAAGHVNTTTSASVFIGAGAGGTSDTETTAGFITANNQIMIGSAVSSSISNQTKIGNRLQETVIFDGPLRDSIAFSTVGGHITASGNISSSLTGSFGNLRVGTNHGGIGRIGINTTTPVTALDIHPINSSAGGDIMRIYSHFDTVQFFLELASIDRSGDKDYFFKYTGNSGADSELLRLSGKELNVQIPTSLKVTNHITASGNISGSATSTGSFGILQLSDYGQGAGGSYDGNVFFGPGAGGTVVTGYNNIGIGLEPGKSITDGVENILIGGYAGDAITSGQYNTIIGHQAGSALVSGRMIVAMGYRSLYAIGGSTSGHVAIGGQTLVTLSTGPTGLYTPGSEGAGANVAVGWGAGWSNTTTSMSVFLGSRAGGGPSLGNAAYDTAHNQIMIGHEVRSTQHNQTIIGSKLQETVILSGSSPISFNTAGGHITASGNISASGTITMLTASIGGGIFTSASLAAGGSGGGGGGDLSNIVEDTTPQLGGNLDLNTNTISGSGNIKFSGSLEVSTVNATNDFFLLKSGSLNALKVNGEGVLRLGGFKFTPTAVSGGFYYNDSDDEFYLGKENN